MEVIELIVQKKNTLKHRISKLYHSYGLWCAIHPLPMILFSIFIVLLCSLPLCSLPVFERLVAFLFHRVQVNYKTTVQRVNVRDVPRHELFAYVQQVNVNVSFPAGVNADDEMAIYQALQSPTLTRILDFISEPDGSWRKVCLKLGRAGPSMKALMKRIRYSRIRFHGDLNKLKMYEEDCLVVFPRYLLKVASNESVSRRRRISIPFKELSTGYPIRKREEIDPHDKAHHRHVAFTFTFFLTEFDEPFLVSLRSLVHVPIKEPSTGPSQHVEDSLAGEPAVHISYVFSNIMRPLEVIPLSFAYLLGFLYLWFSIKKLDLIRTRWGLAFSAVCSFFSSFSMAVGICAYWDALPREANVTEIFPYVVLIIGLENFAVITKSVMQTRKILEVKDRVAEGLENEGWYITKNLLVEMLLLGLAYISGVQAIREFAVLAFVGYWTGFFMNLSFFTPILAVDTRRANLSECVTIRQSFEYGFFNISPAQESCDSGHAHLQGTSRKAEPTPMTLSIKAVYIVARWRIVQRTVMVVIMLYLYHLMYLKLRWTEILPRSSEPLPPQTLFEMASLKNSHNAPQCLTEAEAQDRQHVESWQFLCLKHWPELLNYYFVHLNGSSLVVLPQLNVPVDLSGSEPLVRATARPPIQHLFAEFIGMWKVLLVFFVLLSVIVGLVVKHIWNCLKDHGIRMPMADNIYEYQQLALDPPVKFRHMVTCIAYNEEEDSLACAYVSGNIFIWDLYQEKCTSMIDRRTGFEVRDLTRLPLLDDGTSEVERDEPILDVIWSIGFKFQRLVVACRTGKIEVYSIEPETSYYTDDITQQLLCIYQPTHNLGYTHLQIISGRQFVAARQDGTLDAFLLSTHQDLVLEAQSIEEVDSRPSHSCALSSSVQPFLKRDFINILQYGATRVFVVNIQGQMKIVSLSAEGTMRAIEPTFDDHVTTILVDSLLSQVYVGTSTGGTHVMSAASGGTRVTLHSTASEIEAVAMDTRHVAVLTNGLVTVWLKNGFEELCRLQPLKNERIFDIQFLPQHTLAAIGKVSVVLINVLTQTIIDTIQYTRPPGVDTQCLPRVARQSLVLCTGVSLTQLKFLRLTDRDK